MDQLRTDLKSILASAKKLDLWNSAEGFYKRAHFVLTIL